MSPIGPSAAFERAARAEIRRLNRRLGPLERKATGLRKDLEEIEDRIGPLAEQRKTLLELLDSGPGLALVPDPADTPNVEIHAIQSAAAAEFSVTVAQLVGAGRPPKLVRARQAAMYLARELTCASLPAIGRAFGHRNHTTVMHAHRTIRAALAVEPDLEAQLERITAALDVPSTPAQTEQAAAAA